MRLPLVVYALLLCLLLAVYAYFQFRKPPRPEAAWGKGAGASKGQAMAEMVADSLRVFALLVGAALLSITFGKPDLLAQYAAWAVIVGQLLKVAAIARGQASTALVLRLFVLACLVVQWVPLLPAFDAIPR